MKVNTAVQPTNPCGRILTLPPMGKGTGVSGGSVKTRRPMWLPH